MGECTQIYSFLSAPPEEEQATLMLQQQQQLHQESNRCVFYLRQAEVDGCRLRDVHDFTVRGHNEHEAVQSLKEEPG